MVVVSLNYDVNEGINSNNRSNRNPNLGNTNLVIAILTLNNNNTSDL